MSTLEQLLAITKNTFQESMRQPVLFVVAMAATLFIILSNPFATFTLENDQRMFVDIGLSSVFLAGVIGAAFIATNVLTREIDNKTVLTVVSKPVPRPLFILGKFLGVAGSVFILMVYLVLVFMIVEIHGSLETAAAKYHLPVIVFGISGISLAFAAGIWCNFFYGWTFGATTLSLLLPITALVYLLCLVFSREFNTQGIGEEFEPQLWIAGGMLFMAILALTAIAIAASTRLGQVLTLLITCGFFMMGLLSDWIFGRPAAAIMAAATKKMPAPEDGVDALPVVLEGSEKIQYALLNFAHMITPNFQIFWLADAVNQEHAIPAGYISSTMLYGVLLIVAALSLAVILFQRREVG